MQGQALKDSSMEPYFRLIRPCHWTKNLLLLVPLFFSGQMDIDSLVLVLYGIICFCIASSLGYIVNDWIDKSRDINHPMKRERPLASGNISAKEAFILWGSLFFLLLFMLFSFAVPGLFIFYISLYIILTISYSIYFKNIILLDIFVISFGYVIRVLAGGAITDIEVSRWLFMSIFFISMIISIAKRRSELILLKGDASNHRENLMRYKIEDLSRMLWILAGVSLVVYAIYCIEKRNNLIYSIIPATYGIMRFCILAERGKTADPVRLFFKDIQLIVAVIIFLVFLGIKIYG